MFFQLSCSQNKNKYLTDEFAKTISNKEYKPEHYENSSKFSKLGLYYYNQKNDLEAVKYYEYALDNHPTSEIYYNYANSLSNISKLDESIKAYEIAISLNYPRKDLIFYNLACAQSRNNEIEKSLKNLKKSVLNGYFNTNNFLKDPDLQYLRNQNNWKEEYEKLLNIKNTLSLKFNIHNFSGNYEEHGGGAASDHFVLCPNGNYFYFYNDCNLQILTGKWQLNTDSISAIIENQLDYECTAEGTGSSCCDEAKFKTITKITNDKRIIFTRNEMIMILKDGIRHGDHANGIHSQITKEKAKINPNLCYKDFQIPENFNHR